MVRRCLLLILALGAAGAHAQVALTRTLSSPSEVTDGRFGATLVGMGDLDGDGAGDVAVGAPGENRVHIVSGRFGATIRTLEAPGTTTGFGAILAAAGDVDGGDVNDLVVGAPLEDASAGRVYVFSGATGALIRSIPNRTSDTDARFGTAVDGAGDVDGDGRDDILVGAPGQDRGRVGAGTVYVLDPVTNRLIRRHDPPEPSTGLGFGTYVLGAGDTSGDGIPDVIIGVLDADRTNYGIDGADGALRFTSAGALLGQTADATGDGFPDFITRTLNGPVRIVDGVSGALYLSLSSPDPVPNVAPFGTSVATLDDADGDGEPELAVGSPGETPDRAGRIYIHDLRTGALLTTLESPTATLNGGLGTAIASLGDTDGDGRTDFAVGAPYESTSPDRPRAGQAHVFSRLDPSVPVFPITLRPPPPPPGVIEFGTALAAIGDVTGDGTFDVVVGAPELSSPAYVFDGRSGSLLYGIPRPNPFPNALFGTSVAATGDVDGDAVPDILVGAPRARRTSDGPKFGQAYLFSGATGALLRVLESPWNDEARFGETVAGLADVTGDGVLDIAVGAKLAGPTGTGLVYVFDAASGALVHTLASPNPVAGGQFGASLTRLRDVDGDGVGDLAVGAPQELVSPLQQAGRVYVLSGATGAVLHTLVSPDPGAGRRFGTTVERIGRVSEPAAPDLAVGVPLEGGPGAQRSGLVHLYHAATAELARTLTSPTPAVDGLFGTSISIAGDVNRDGVFDVAVGAPGESTVHVFDGASGAALHALTSPHARDGRFGTTVAGVRGDISQDGIDDLFVSAPGDFSTGRAYIVAVPDGVPVGGEVPPGPATDALALRVVPNPSRGAARVEVTLPEAADVSVEVFDVLGRRVSLLVPGRLAAGAHAFALEARPAAGVYVVRLRAGEAVVTRRMTRL